MLIRFVSRSLYVITEHSLLSTFNNNTSFRVFPDTVRRLYGEGLETLPLSPKYGPGKHNLRSVHILATKKIII
jgi:hypothetical protein